MFSNASSESAILAQAERDRTVMRVIAHRGLAGQGPENTLQAVEAAAGVADGIEVDVRACADGRAVILHDARLDRTTDRNGRLAEHSFEAVRGATVDGTDGSVPTPEEVLEAVPESVEVIFDLKEPAVVDPVLELLEGGHDRVTVSTANPIILDALVSKGVPGGLATIVGSPLPGSILRRVEPLLGSGPLEAIIARAKWANCRAINARTDLCLSTPLVEQAHAEGLEVNAWTVRTSAEARRLVAAGVDGLIADVPVSVVSPARDRQ